MFYSARPVCVLVALFILITGCSRQTTREPAVRLAIVPVENSTPDPSQTWMTRAIPGILAVELTGSQNIQPLEVTSSSDPQAARAQQTLQAYFSIRNGQLEVHGTVIDRRTNKTAKTLSASGPMSAGVLPVVNTIAKQLSSNARPFGTQNETAVREYYEAVGSQTPDEALSHLDKSLHADPSFGAAYIARIQTLIAKRDIPAAKTALADAQKAAPKFSEYERARFAAMNAALTGDIKTRDQTIAALAKLEPANADLRQTLGDLNMAQKDYKGAIASYTEGTQIAPSDIGLWNGLAYAQAFTGDTAAALRSIAEFRKLAPANPTAVNTAGEIQFFSGDYKAAEKSFVTANDMNGMQLGGADAYRAALCRILMGDPKGAESIFVMFVKMRQAGGSQLIGLESAIFLADLGKTQDAIGAARKISSEVKVRDAASLAHSQLGIWYLDANQRADALKEAQAAVQAATAGTPRTLAGAVGFLAQPSASVDEWRKRVDQGIPAAQQGRLHDELLAYALTFDHHFAEAVPIWQKLYDTTPAQQATGITVELAYALNMTGRSGDAAKVLKSGVVPPRSPEPGFDSLAFPRFVELRKKLGLAK